MVSLGMDANRKAVAREITDALETGAIHFALGFPPSVSGTERVDLLRECYAVVVRAGHPMAKASNASDARMRFQDLRRLEYVPVRSHSETLRILQQPVSMADWS
ncbi:hypothetical protein [Variovorax fucosicus]|uniref:hypothetical protein n=1 Tax=Variovorax fucosicus TaxID=3053517 RepID=UPI00257599AA|nr:hypothetical protein [Variovorax sp. J22G47]MDM0059132.1 hypothetical protein [Variovorax sp. J22G47]